MDGRLLLDELNDHGWAKAKGSLSELQLSLALLGASPVRSQRGRARSVLRPYAAGDAPTNFVEAKTTDERVYRTFFHAMLAEGIALAPGAYEALFVGLAHTDDVLDAIGEAAGRAASATARQLG